MPVGERLRQLRELAGLSQSELARRANVPQPTISSIERGRQQNITLEHARRIARALGVTIDMLAGPGDDES
jgi:transcriptional regulator with XRE-family HTH domain